MTLQEIKTSVENGEIVHWKNSRYRVIKDSENQWLIQCGADCIGLTWTDGVTLNGSEVDFFLAEYAELMAALEWVEAVLKTKATGDSATET